MGVLVTVAVLVKLLVGVGVLVLVRLFDGDFVRDSEVLGDAEVVAVRVAVLVAVVSAVQPPRGN